MAKIACINRLGTLPSEMVVMREIAYLKKDFCALNPANTKQDTLAILMIVKLYGGRMQKFRLGLLLYFPLCHLYVNLHNLRHRHFTNKSKSHLLQKKSKFRRTKAGIHCWIYFTNIFVWSICFINLKQKFLMEGLSTCCKRISLGSPFKKNGWKKPLIFVHNLNYLDVWNMSSHKRFILLANAKQSWGKVWRHEYYCFIWLVGSFKDPNSIQVGF